MDDVQPIVQRVQKCSSPNGGVQWRGGDGNHLCLAVPGVVQPAEELVLLFTIEGVHVSENQRPTGGHDREGIAGRAVVNRPSQRGCQRQEARLRRIARAADEHVRMPLTENRPEVRWWIKAKV